MFPYPRMCLKVRQMSRLITLTQKNDDIMKYCSRKPILTIKVKLDADNSARYPIFRAGSVKIQGFPKEARISEMKHMPHLLSEDREGKIIEISTLNI